MMKLSFLTTILTSLLISAYASQHVTTSTCNEQLSPGGCDYWKSPIDSFMVGTNSLYIEYKGQLIATGKTDTYDNTACEINGALYEENVERLWKSSECKSVYDGPPNYRTYISCVVGGKASLSAVYDVKGV